MIQSIWSVCRTKIVICNIKESKLIISAPNGIEICSHNLNESTTRVLNYNTEHYKQALSNSLPNANDIDAICEHNLKMFDKL